MIFMWIRCHEIMQDFPSSGYQDSGSYYRYLLTADGKAGPIQETVGDLGKWGAEVPNIFNRESFILDGLGET